MDLLPCCKQRWLEQKSWGTDPNCFDTLQKVVKDIEMGEQEQEAMEKELNTRNGAEVERSEKLSCCSA